jgi:4-amino-4-deoxy-L-arabinose transferase-like glycosyltransferase
MTFGSIRNITLIIACAAALYLIGNGSVSLWDRDEPRYAQTSRQMLQSGDWVVPHYLDKVRTAKPVFIYWCQATSMRVFGDQGDAGVFAARFPSAVAMTVVLILLTVVFRKYVGPERTFWSLLILATSGLVLWSAKACTTDAVLLLGVTVSQLCLHAIWRGRASWPVVIALALGIAEAGLTKGPVVLGILAMTLAMLGLFRLIDRRTPSSRYSEERAGEWGREDVSSPPLPNPLPGVPGRGKLGAVLKLLVAIAIITLLVAPWLYLVQKRASAFLGSSVSHDVLNRIAQPLEGHRGPPGYHLALLFATFFPWSILLPMAIVSAWKNRSDPQIRFALAAVIGPWLMFEIVQTKMPPYMLPTFPAIAFLTADAVVRCLRGEKDDLNGRGIAVGATIIGTVAMAIAAVTVGASRAFGESLTAPTILAATAVAFAAVVIVSFRRGMAPTGLLAMGVGVACIYAVLFGLYLPRAEHLKLSKRAADILNHSRPSQPGNTEMIDYKEPSLAFYEGGNVRENSSMTLSQNVVDKLPRFLVTTSDVWNKTSPEVRDRFDEIDSVTGLAYADGGRVLDVKVLRRKR